MKKKFVTTLVALVFVVMASPVFAMSLHEARASGAVGEKMDGYVTALKNSPDVNALVQEVNQKRRQEYERISQENNQPVDVVGKLAAKQIVNNLQSGERYQADDGSWKTRP